MTKCYKGNCLKEEHLFLYLWQSVLVFVAKSDFDTSLQ